MIIWWLFDDYLHYCDYSLHRNVNVNDSPVFAFARLCCLKIPVARPARPAKVTSDLLDSSLQGVPRALWCTRWRLYERKDSNSLLQFMHLKFKNRSVCLLCVWLIWRRIGNLTKCNASDWASWLPLASFTVTWTAERLKYAWPQPILQNTKEQYAEIMIIKARIINERDDVIHVLKRSTKGSKIRNQIDSTRLECDFTTTCICCMLWDDQICNSASI